MMPTNQLSLETLQQDVQTILKLWPGGDLSESAFAQLYLVQKAQLEEGNDLQKIVNQVLLQGLERLEVKEPIQARLLQLRFLEKQTVYITANQLNIAESTVYATQRTAIQELAKQIWESEQQSITQHRSQLEQRLEAPTYTELIGVEAHLAELTELLTEPGPPWVISIEGIGGLGKTALADTLMRRMMGLPTYHDFGWLTARQEQFDLGGGISTLQRPALTTEHLIEQLVAQLTNDASLETSRPVDKKQEFLTGRLKEYPHLIVIDNLETVADVSELLPLLRQFSNPSRFVLTSRQRFETAFGIYHFPVPELQAQDALKLVRQEAALANLPHLAQGADHELQSIYETVGGNPLALRLLVGQTHAHSLSVILDDLKAARGQKVENLYTFIFRRAWESLDVGARKVWLCLPLLQGQQAMVQELSAITEMGESEVRTNLERLIQLNLVNCHGTLHDRYYSLHSLTRTFLQEQVAQWM